MRYKKLKLYLVVLVTLGVTNVTLANPSEIILPTTEKIYVHLYDCNDIVLQIGFNISGKLPTWQWITPTDELHDRFYKSTTIALTDNADRIIQIKMDKLEGRACE